MKLKSIGVIALVLAMVPTLVFGGMMAKIKAHMHPKAGSTMSATHPGFLAKLHGAKGAGGSKMGGMMGMHMGKIIGNKNTKVYHMPGDKNLPDEKNRVYFSSVAAATAAGYHASGSGSKVGGKKSSKMAPSTMATGKHHKKK